MSEVQNTFSGAPAWLHVRIDPGLPTQCRILAELFIASAQRILGDEAPKRALLRLRDYRNVEIKFFATPRLPAEKLDAMNCLAERVSHLANALRARDDTRKQELESDGELPAVLTEDEQYGGFDCAPSSEQPEVPPKVRVFSWDESVLVGGADRGRDTEGATRTGRAMKRLRSTGAFRELCTPLATWMRVSDELAEGFPNFAGVISSVIRPHVALTARRIPHRLPPLLLVGPPGVGKTHFAECLARLLNVPPPIVISLAAETNGSAVGGSSTFWSNSSPGKVFEMLAWGHRGGLAVANGLIVLDEIDKAPDSRYAPLGSLYELLEADTSRRFVDQSLPDVSIDASHLRIVCTANELDAIPAPLRNRMFVFEVNAPSADQNRRIVQQIFASTIERLGVQLEPDLPEALLKEACRLEPRTARLLLESAIANAVAHDRSCLNSSDWETVRCACTTAGRRPPIGFTGAP